MFTARSARVHTTTSPVPLMYPWGLLPDAMIDPYEELCREHEHGRIARRGQVFKQSDDGYWADIWVFEGVGVPITEGFALAGGLELALSCDLLVAAKGVKEVAYHLDDSDAKAYFCFEGTAELAIGEAGPVAWPRRGPGPREQ